MTQQTHAHAASTNRVEKTRRWPVRMAGALLALEGAGALAVSLRMGVRQGWVERAADNFLSPGVMILSANAVFAAIALLAFVSAAGFLLLRPGAWLIGMIVQSLTLATTLSFHFHDGPDLVYVLMGYGVLVVFYINSRPVRSVLHGNSLGGQNG